MAEFNLLHQFIPISSGKSEEGSEYLLRIKKDIDEIRHIGTSLGPKANDEIKMLLRTLEGEGRFGTNISGLDNLYQAQRTIDQAKQYREDLRSDLFRDPDTITAYNNLSNEDKGKIGHFFRNISNVDNSIAGAIKLQSEINYQSKTTDQSTLSALYKKDKNEPLDVMLTNRNNFGIAAVNDTSLLVTPTLFGSETYREKNDAINTLAHEFTHSIDRKGLFNKDTKINKLVLQVTEEANNILPEMLESTGSNFPTGYFTSKDEILARVVAHGVGGGKSPYPHGDELYKELIDRGYISNELITNIQNLAGIVETKGSGGKDLLKIMSKKGGIYTQGYASGGRVRGNKVIKVGENGDEYIISNDMLKRLENILGGPVTDENLLTAVQSGALTTGKSQTLQTGHIDEPPGVRNITRTRVVVPKQVPPVAKPPEPVPAEGSFEEDLRSIQEDINTPPTQTAGGAVGGGKKPPKNAAPTEPETPEDAEYRKKQEEIKANNAKAKKLVVDEEVELSRKRVRVAEEKAEKKRREYEQAIQDAQDSGEERIVSNPPAGSARTGGYSTTQSSGANTTEFGTPPARRATLKANNPELFAEAEKLGGVKDLSSEKLKVATKVTTDLNDNMTRLTVTMQEASGATKKYTVAQDLATGQVGPEDEIAANSKINKRVAQNARYAAGKQQEFEQLGYPQVYKELAKRDPEYLKAGAVTDLSVKQRNNVKIFDVERQDPAGNPVQTRILTDIKGNVLPETTRRTADFTRAIANNSLEFLKWTAAVSIVYTPLLKLQELIKLSIQNQTQLTSVMITMNAAQEDTNKIFESAAKIANETGTSITNILEGYNQAFRATGDIKDQTERYAKANIVLKDSLTLSKLALIDQSSATDILVASLRQTGKSVDDGTSLLDKWVAVSKVANVDVNTLATSFAIVAESADNAGLSIDELNGLIATVAASGITSAKETGNAVRAIITGVTNNDAIKQLEKFGIAVQNSQGQARTFKEIMTDIRAGVDQGTINPDQLNTLARAIGGGNRRQAQVVTAIVGQETASTAELASARANGEAQKALEMQLSTVESATINLSNAFQTLAQTLGTEGGLLAIVTDVTEGTTNLVGALNNVAKFLGTALPVLAVTGAAKGLGLPKGLGNITAEASDRLYALKERTTDQDTARRMNSQTGIDYSLAFRQLQEKSIERNQPFSQRVGQAVTNWSPGILTAGAFAYSNAVQGHPAQAAISGGTAIAGEFIGKALGAAPGIGAAIGGSMAEIFIQMWNHAITEFRSTVYKEGETEGKPKKEPTYEEKVAGLTQEQKLGLFGQAGGRPVPAADVEQLANTGRWQQNNMAGLPGILHDLGVTKQAPDQFETALQQAVQNDPEFAKLSQANGGFGGVSKEDIARIESRLRAQLEKFMAPELATGEGSQFNLFNQMKGNVGQPDYIKTLQAQSREDLKKRMQPYAENPMTVKQYTEAMGNIEGYQNKLPALVAAGELSGGVTNTTKALKEFTDLLNKGATESVSEIITLANDIGDLSSLIAAAKTAGLTQIEYGGEKIDIPKAESLLTTRKETYNQAVTTEQTNIKLREPIRDITSMLDVTSQQFTLVQQKAQELYQEDLAQLTETEKASSEARDANIDYLVKVKDDYVEVKKLQSNYLDAAKQRLEEEGKLNVKPAGFSQDKDLTLAQYRLAQSLYPGRLASVQSTAAAAGGTYKEEKTQQVVMAKDGMMWLDTDMRIFQSLLAEISENTKKMVDGMFNLPEGASFWVPYSAVNSYYNKNAGTVATPGGGITPEQAAKVTPNEATALGVNSPRTPANITLDENVMARQAMQAARMAELAKSTATPPPARLSAPPSQYPFMTAGGPDFGLRALQGLSYKGISGFMDAGAGAQNRVRDNVASKLPEVSTNLNLNISASFQVNLNSAVLARELKSILTTDLLKFGNNATSVTRTVII